MTDDEYRLKIYNIKKECNKDIRSVAIFTALVSIIAIMLTVKIDVATVEKVNEMINSEVSREITIFKIAIVHLMKYGLIGTAIESVLNVKNSINYKKKKLDKLQQEYNSSTSNKSKTLAKRKKRKNR